MQDLLSDSSNGVLLTPTNSPSPPLNQKQQFLQQHQPVTTAAQHNNVLTSPMTSSMTSSSSGTQAPILLRPDEFLSPRITENHNTSSLLTTPSNATLSYNDLTISSHSDRASNTVNQDLAPVKVVKHNGGLLSASLLQSSISSSVDFDPHRPRQPNDNNVDDDDDDDEVGEEERGDVEGADRDRPDGGTRARVGASGGAGTSGRTSGNGGDRFFDRGGDGGGDGNSSSATSSASQEVTEILEGAAGVGAMEGLSSINQEKSSSDDEDVDDGDVEDDEDDDDDETFMPHLKLMQKSQQQQQQMSSSLYMEQQQQIAHHLPNLNVMNIPPLPHHAVSSSISSTSNQHHHQYMMSTSLFELAPVTSHSPMYHSAYHPSHPSWNAGKVAGDEAGKSLEELPVAAATNTNLAERERKSLDGLPIISKALHLADYSDGIRILANQQSRLPEIPLKIGPTTYDIMDQLRSQDQQIKFLSSQLQLQTTQFDGSLRSLGHQLDDVSKNVDSLCVAFNRDDYAQKEALTECKLEEMFREFMMRYERSQAEHLQHTTNTLQANIDVQLEKIVSNEIKKTILPKVEQSLDVIKEKISHDVSQKLASIDNNIKINLTKMLKSKPTIDSIGQSISSELRGNLRSINQDIVVPSLEKGCQNIIEQLNASFKAGTQQYIQSLESHLNQTRKTLESHKHPAVIQLKSASETLTHFETKQQQIQTQLNATIQSLQNQISHLQQATTAVVAAVGGKNTHDEIKLFSKLNELQNMLITEVKTLLSEELVSLLKYQQVAIKDQFDAALRSVTPAPSNSSHHSDHISNKNHIIACIKASKFNDAFQTALSATDLALVEFTCESVEISVVFGNSSLLSQSVLLSLIQQLGADLNTKPELKYRFLDEAIVFLDPYDPVTKEHLDVVLKQLQVNLLDYIDRKVDSAMASKMNKLLRRTMLALRSVS
ncbi:hypothetical protein HELRODRAFT_190529 [Helobdella robusta]|uniref:Enhancer of mRNA-decapping protein 4 C-terminal domain-containing protein n=1 Tax=Helobdella robusta TaxID=6412 RepID=T1FS27_HELRO|nr:hypothetical protein HELRODRAFT_190529 [Helobdella robusta]ESO09509.1 hypothetical protein HELRODRAFT_190529 [Helobdella robusta]